MKISQNDWIRYREMMSKISRKAAEEFDARFRGRINTVERKEVIDYAMALVEKYSEASSELACQMYERIAALSGVDIPPAEPAKAAEYGEVAKGINGTLKQSPEGKLCSDVVDRLVKRAGADTMLKNAERDRAQFAWVPHGDTCSFCIMLASRGWQNISKKAWKNGHAEHIHAHCDCQYCVRFNQNTEVEGYDPDQYLEMYENADGDKWRDKLNAMRRNQNQYLFRNETNAGEFSSLPEKMSRKHIRDVAKEYNISLKNVIIQIDRDVEKLKSNFKYAGRADPNNIGRIDFFPKAFASKEELVRTIYHERIHVIQFREYGSKYVQNNRAYFENLAYDEEERFITLLKEKGLL